MINLNSERMTGYGPFVIDGHQVNYLYGLDDLCKKYIKPQFEILELGSNMGVSTELLASYAKKVVSVDINFTIEMKKVIDRNQNIEFHHKSFSQFFSENNLQFDLIYIDGSHEARDVEKDIFNSLKLVKSPGFICGHDFHSEYPGLMQVVNKFFNEVEVFSDSSWLKKIGN